MKKLIIKHQYITALLLTLLTLFAFDQTSDTALPARTAAANKALKSSSLETNSGVLDRVAFSRDGNVLATVDDGGQIILSDVATGQARATYSSQSASLISGVVFSSDAQTLASVSDNSIQLWDVASGSVRLSLSTSSLVTGLEFSPDGKSLAALGQDNRLTIWNLQSGSPTEIESGHQGGINAIAYSPDNTIVATAGQDAHILLRDLQSGVLIQDLIGHQGGVNAIAFSPDNKIMASGGQDAQIKLWDIVSGKEQASLPGDGGVAVTDLVFSPDGKALVSVGESDPVFLWDVSNKLPQILTGHRDWVVKAVFNANQKTLASVDKTGQVVVWDLANGLEQLVYQVPLSGAAGVSSQIPSLAAGVNSQTATSGSSANNSSVANVGKAAVPNRSVQVGTKAAPDQIDKLLRKKKSSHDWKGVTALAISPDGTLYGGATRDGKVRLWTSSGKERFVKAEHHGAAVTGVDFTADNKRIVSVGRDTELQITDVANGKKLKTLSAHEHPIRTVAASPDGKFYASGGEETRIMLWDAKADKLIKILSGHTDFVNAVRFSPDGARLASAGANGRILLFNVQTGKLEQTLLGHSDEVNDVAYSRDGKILASGSSDKLVILWDAVTGQQIQAFEGQQAPVRAVAISPNGKKLVSTGEDGKILVWDINTRKLARQINGATKAVNAAVFSPLGKLIAGSENGEVTEWDVEQGQKQQTINVPIQPQSSNSEAATNLFSSIESLPASTEQIIQPNAAPLAANTLPTIFNRVLDWLIPSAEAAIPEPPGGPILIVTNGSPSFGNYYAEILRTEGFNEFSVADISNVNATTLAAYDVVILAEMPLDAATQVPVFENWVNSGGNLIAMRPDKDLASVLGLTDASSTLDNGYLLVNTSASPGNGIVGETMQFHGTADRYTSNGATVIATLYFNAATATSNPAVTLRSVGTSGGQAAAFTYDLAKSIVYTRQGNPAWASQERDGFAPIRSDDKFFGNATGDPQVDWVDFNKIAIPQADEQQRLLVNLILEMNRDKKPLPRFWYFPKDKKAVVIMTGDDHANNGTQGRFDQFLAASPAGCSVADWECIRGTSYIFPNTPLTAAQAASYNTQGFEVGLHINTNCADYTPASLRANYTQQIGDFTAKYSSDLNPALNIPAPITQRHHCIAWSDWVTGAIVQLENGIRFDTSYYFWPPSWVLNRPGFFSGSGMPMRFANLDGSLIDVYHAASQMTDESGQTYPFTINTLLDRALGVEGYYGAFTINAHTDVATITESDAVIASAPPRGVPIVSSKQMLDWLDGRNSSSFGALTWNDASKTLNFSVTVGSGANNLRGMLPASSSAGVLLSITYTSGGSPALVSFTVDTIKGISYGFFPALAGTYTATYGADTTPPVVTVKSPSAGATAVSLGSPVTATFSEPMDVSTINGSTFELRGPAPANTLIPATINFNAATRTATLTPSASLAGLTAYTATVKGGAGGAEDMAGNALAANESWSFTTEAQPCASAPCSAWPDSTVPGTPSVNDPSAVTLGVKFRSDLGGLITGIRFYQANAGTYTGTLWTLGGQQLATGTVTATGSGWKQVTFAAPVAVTANTVYVASYHAPNGNYAATNSGFAAQGVDAPPIHLLRDGVSGGNGVYAYGASSTFPTNTYASSNYWVDVGFTTSIGPDTTPPTVTAQSPSAGATGVAVNAAVSATFSEAINTATVNATNFELRNASNELVAATVAYDAATRTAMLTPSTALANNATYTATVRGGATDPRVKDLADNALAANATWSFTTAAATPPTGCTSGSSIWAPTTIPATTAASDTGAVELGVKFRSTASGYICGVRFYKGTGNSGTHVGKLWTSSGTLLASATFINETATGWQQVNFASPVQVTANTVYVASYHAPAGRYAINSNFFAAAVNNGPLTALSSSESANGVFLYGAGGFPSNTWNASNYWVDVVFTTSIGPDTTPPTVSSTLPANGATGVVPGNPVSVTFSEPMDSATITPTSFTLTPSIPEAVLSYNAATNTATLTPAANSPLASTTTYTARVLGGASGVKDAAGNALAADYTWSFTTGVDPCSTGGNPIVCENTKTGSPASEWDVSGAGDTSIQGYATDISVNRGETVRFKIDTPATDYRLDIYRMGYYAGSGARKVATVQPSAGLPQNQPACLNHAATGLIDCGNWAESASWLVPATTTSGIYFAKAVREDGVDTGKASHIVFIVRDDTSTSDILFQTADTTWHAYNTYGGNSLYTGSPAGRAYKVSYNRPFNTRIVDNGQDWLFNAEYPMVRWLEANGYNVSYFTGVDSDRRGSLIRNHKLFLSNGHDEYWSKQQRENVEKARDNTLVNQINPVNLAFFSGNEVFWKTRWENNIINTSGALGTDSYRTLVCYKETHAGAKIDPLPNVWTGTWRDPRFSPPADGGRPENALMGPIFTVNDGATTSITVPEADGKMRFWRNTSIANLATGASATLPFGTLGYEWDEDLDNGFRPAGLVRLSTTIVNNAPVLTDYGSSFGSGTANHALTLYRATSGALVFGAGTVQWAWGLDSNHDRAGTPTDANMQQATVNLFADMGVQPGNLISGLVAATASTDITRPSSTITSPAGGANVPLGSDITITGTATDTGGRVGGVEVSVDGGTTWRRATGRANWTYTWRAPSSATTVNIKSRAVDDSLNMETPAAGVTVNVGSGPDNIPPTVTAQSPAAGATGVAVNTAVTATFSEAMDGATITTSTFELRGPAPASTLVTATVGYNASTRTATLTPTTALSTSTAYTATVKGSAAGVKDAASNALAADAVWTFTIADTVATGCSGSTSSIWPANPTPAIISDSDTSSVELGVKFRADQDGSICGIRFYKGSTNTGTHIGKLWSSTGTLLASATFQNETASGWQQVNFASPVQITAGSQYVASYLAPVGRYSANSNYFTAGVTSNPLYAFSSSESGGNGVYQYGSGGFPSNSYQASNYWVDVVFAPGVSQPSDTTPPTVSSTLPAASATGVAPANPVTVTFSEAMAAATISSATIELRDASSALVAASVTYNAATNTATLTPNTTLVNSTVYTAKVIGGTSGVKDVAGNALAADYSWSFTTGVAGTGSDTTPPTVPANPSATATSATQISLSWTASNDNIGVTGYRVERCQGPGCTSFLQVATPTTTSFPDTGLTAGTTYQYRVRATDAAGNLSEYSSVASATTQTATVTSTGFLSPAANAAVTSGAGANNGFQTTPVNAYVSDNLYAVDTNSGIGTSLSCTAITKDKHNYYNFNVNIPGGSSINGIEVRLEALADSNSGSPKMCVQLSWDGGASWTVAKSTAALGTTKTTYILGGAADSWERTWAVNELANTNFRVRIINVASSTARDFSLDWAAVQVTYQ